MSVLLLFTLILALSHGEPETFTCTTTKVGAVITVECQDRAKTILDIPKEHWPEAWKYAEGDHHWNFPLRTQDLPKVGQKHKAFWEGKSFIALEPCEVRVHKRVNQWAKDHPGDRVPLTIMEPAADCQEK